MSDLKPDYSSYSVAELNEARETVDKLQFPERFAEIQSELAERGVGNPEATNAQKSAENTVKKVPNILTKTDSKIIHFIIRVWCIILFYLPASDLHEVFMEGTTYARRLGTISYESNPFSFSIEVAKSIVLAGLLIFGFIKNPLALGKKGEPQA
ncbi:MAG: hypothetical protein VX649_13155 [Pseudomonadota bacterium]|jgi:hypothetical protein|nr:hypothetical protein [Pseudomonadota bacterium]MEC9165043.1 hypothetical protein [Pseudomonadota bacterium]|tara:strand:+ start:62 stop:523 length:462 start_codon:yes stop_codon:yes gene_type:complete